MFVVIARPAFAFAIDIQCTIAVMCRLANLLTICTQDEVPDHHRKSIEGFWVQLYENRWVDDTQSERQCDASFTGRPGVSNYAG